MKGTLILAVLSVSSSYREAAECPCSDGGVPDTLQWWIGQETAWRIKTFARDHDIHIWSMRPHDGLLAQAQENNRKHYGDVIARQCVLSFLDCSDAVEVARVFAGVHLPPRLERAPAGFAFWKPDEAEYRTQSRPEQR